ncbi:aldehyde dehydrogenase family protein [Streptomyces gilvus]|uniref:aldehyde dehydrogenase family protein n=1 Tax=Streptomyces gilvus TaxID=2920937 RepID=UPI0035A85B81
MRIPDVHQLIGGAWGPADSGEWLTVENPGRREMIARVPASGASDVDRAVEAAKAAFPAWRAKPSRERGALLIKHFDGGLRQQDDPRAPRSRPCTRARITDAWSQACSGEQPWGSVRTSCRASLGPGLARGHDRGDERSEAIDLAGAHVCGERDPPPGPGRPAPGMEPRRQGRLMPPLAVNRPTSGHTASDRQPGLPPAAQPAGSRVRQAIGARCQKPVPTHRRPGGKPNLPAVSQRGHRPGPRCRPGRIARRSARSKSGVHPSAAAAPEQRAGRRSPVPAWSDAAASPRTAIGTWAIGGHASTPQLLSIAQQVRIGACPRSPPLLLACA